MGRMWRIGGMAVVLACLAGGAGAADTVPAHLEAAKAAHGRGDLARAATELEAAVAELHARIGKVLSDFMPKPLAGWQGDAPETQGLAGAGGGLSVSRAYGKDEASLNAAVILDSPAVAAAVALFTPSAQLQPNSRRIKLGNDDAILRWDSANRSGEVVVVLGSRALLQIEGDNLGAADPLVEAAKGWNLAGIRKFLGL